MAESEVKSAAQWLGKLMVEEMNYLGAVTGKVEILKTELNTLAAFLTDAALRSRRQNNVVRTTLLEAKNIACDCEDVIENYILQVARRGYEEYEGCNLGTVMRWACLIRTAIHVHGIHSKIDELNARFSALKSCIVSYGVSDRIIAAEINPAIYQNEPLRQISPHEREVAVGLESQLADLVPRLLDPTDHTVISICGMGGIGKSMLARELYHHPELRNGFFEAFGWAIASQQLQPEQLLRTLLYSLVPENDREGRSRIEEHIKSDGAHAALFKVMSEARCLVVIDDLWTSVDWGRLQSAFPIEGATRSRILLTTRKGDILSGLDPNQVHLHPIEGLDGTQSWELFRRTAFPSESRTDSTKEELGREMLIHCNGVPLAIVVLAKTLKRKERVEEWKQMRNDISVQIQRGGAPSFYKPVYDVLQVSYDELPYHLKHCFLHLANFPEDYEIPAQKLYQLWIGEGIVSKEDPNELEEDIAEGYLKELVSRSMVQVATWVEGTDQLRIEKCRLHDLMRDVCMEIAKREGFVQLISCKEPMLLNADHLLMTLLPERDRRLRRLAVNVSDQPSILNVTAPISSSARVSKAPNLRSLLLFLSNCEQQFQSCRKFVETISNDFPLLRVLDCESFFIKGKLPKKVGNLIHLRYLGLAGTHVSKLPSSIEKLHWLQTLDLRVNHGVVVSLPNVLWKMKQLRHVYLPHYGDLGLATQNENKGAMQRYVIEGGGMLRLDGLRNLQTLINIDLDRVDANDILMLEGRLKMVSAACEANKEALDHILRGSSSMKSFTLKLHANILNLDPTILSSCEAMCSYLDIHSKPYSSFHLRQPLRLEMLPQSLVYLGIWYLQLQDDPMPVLGKLPKLLHLDLHMCYAGQEMVCSTGGFPELMDLCFDGLFSLRYWVVEQGTLQKLNRVRIINCQVKKIPDALPSSVNVFI